MQNYIGYGFNTDQIETNDWVELVKTYDPEEYKSIEEKASKLIRNAEDAEEIIADDVMRFIDDNSMSRADYLKNIINGQEAEIAGTDYIVSAYDDFLVFDSVRFADDSKRTKYIRSQDDFIVLIEKYISIDEIIFGNLYEGVEWIDPCFFLE